MTTTTTKPLTFTVNAYRRVSGGITKWEAKVWQGDKCVANPGGYPSKDAARLAAIERIRSMEDAA